MSLSACLLDKYGSAGHSFTESALTSIKTLDQINPSGGTLHAERLISTASRILGNSVFFFLMSVYKNNTMTHG